MLTDTLRRERAAHGAYTLLLDSGAALTWRARWDTGRDHTPDLGPLAVVWTPPSFERFATEAAWREHNA